MASTTHLVDTGQLEVDAPASALELPETWSAGSDPGPALAVFSDSRTLSPAIETNLVLTAAALTEGTTVASWQAEVRAERLATLPDLQILDERATTAADGDALWYSSSVMTDPQGVTVLTRRWSRVTEGTGLTLTLTTLPLIDLQHAETLDAIAASWTLEAAAAKETPDAHA